MLNRFKIEHVQEMQQTNLWRTDVMEQGKHASKIYKK